MAKIIFKTWLPGMRKIPFTKLLHEKAGLSLTEAKIKKDNFVDNNQSFYIEIFDLKLAKEIADEARGLGVVVELIE